MKLHKRFLYFFVWPIFLLTAIALPCRAANKNGVTPTTISVPSGPGSVEGLGESFQPLLNTGTAEYEVKLDLPDGVNVHTPQLSLTYESGRGDGPAGIGWRFGPGSISRQTDKGIPRYVDGPNELDDDYDGQIDEPDEVDRFVGLEDEELVHLADGTYRARIEGAFIRYRFMGEYWEAHLKDGTRLEFGCTEQARILDHTGSRVFRWLLEKSTDINGNVIEFSYTGFSGSDNQKYLKEIRYGPGQGPWTACYFVYLSYEERPDWRKDYRSGFLIKTAKRLARIDIGLEGVLPEKCAQGDWNQNGTEDALIRRYTLSYDENHTYCSFLSTITQFGADGINSLPPITFSYSTFSPQPSVSAAGAIITSPSAPFTVMDSQLAELIDLNRDSLPDLLKTDFYGGEHTVYLNLGMKKDEIGCRIEWDEGQPVASPDGLALKLHLSDRKVHLADMDGDGISDLIHTAYSQEVFYYPNQGDGTWGVRKRMSIQDTAPPAPFTNDEVKTSDLDFDKRIDVVMSTEAGYTIWFNLRGGKYSRQVRTEGASYQGRVIRFSQTGVHLADLNGDRLNDVARIRPTQVIFCANMGHGHFDAAVEITIPDTVLRDGQNSQIERAHLQDINGDGLADLVVERAQGNELWYWLNRGTDAFSGRHVVTGMPTIFSPDMVTRWADMNGNGTADLVYADSTAESRLRILDIGELAGGSAHPNLLIGINNGLGVQTEITYKSSTEYCQKAREEDLPWSLTIPFPVSVVARVKTTTGLDLDLKPGPDEYIKAYDYRDGFYEDREKAFRGFAEVTVTELGDETAPTCVTISNFFTGGPDGKDNDRDGEIDEVSDEDHREEDALKGLVRDTVVQAADGALFTKEKNDWLVKTLALGTDSTEVRLAYNQGTDTLLYEKTVTPKTLSVTYAYDDFGNVIKENNSGDISIEGDEVITHTEYINNEDTWIIGLPKRRFQTDITGQKVFEQFYYYDGDAYLGLELGVAEKGNLTRTQGWVEGTTYLDIVSYAYDSYGNIIGSMDGNGHQRTIAYDALFHALPVRETIHLGREAQDLIISADYNLGLGVITKSIDFNDQVTAYEYDTFGRLTKIIKPGDSSALPTQHFIYTLADPHQGLIYAYDDEGRLNPIRGPTAASSIKSETREQSGLPETFDSIHYLDGMGRTLAVVEEAETGFIVKEASLFNTRGTPRFTFLPYKAVSSDYTPPDLANSQEETHYDASGREVTKINPPDQSGTATQVSTLYLPLKKTIIDENENKKTFTYDGLARLIEVCENNNAQVCITRYQYDPLDNLTKITDAQNNVKTMTYDGLKRKVEMSDPDCGRKVYTYDRSGNLIKTIDNKGQVILYTYDGADRLLTEDYLDEANLTPDVAYHYDQASADFPQAFNLKGALSWVEDLSGAKFFSYDARGNTIWSVKRIKEGTSSQDFRTSMTYDAMGRVTSMTYPDGDQVHYKYNRRALLKSIPGVIAGIEYHPSAQIASIIYANGIETRYTYDPRHQLIRLETKNPSQKNKILQHLSYTRDGVGNIKTILDGRLLPPDSPANANQTFKYDNLYRLTQAVGQGYGAISYQYDKIGNLTMKKSPEVPHPQHIDDPLINLGLISYGGTSGTSGRTGRLPGDPPGPHAITATQSGLQYGYDDNGNMISHAEGDLYSWDFQNRLTRVQKGKTDARYVYDHQGQRVIKRVDTPEGETTTLYVSAEYEIRNNNIIKYVFAGDRRVARIEGRVSDPTGTDTLEQRLGTQRIDFLPGHNFFSLTVEPENPSVDEVLGPIQGKYTGLWTFDNVLKQYIQLKPDDETNDVTALHASQGYLLKALYPVTLWITGTQISASTPVTTGWNLIGCPAGRRSTIALLPPVIRCSVASVWSYDTKNEEWSCFIRGDHKFLSTLKQVEPGKAYWVQCCPANPSGIDMQPDDASATPHNVTGTTVWPITIPRYQTQAPPQNAMKSHYYHHDHLGSTNILTDANAVDVETIEYFPYGKHRYEVGTCDIFNYTFTDHSYDAESGLIYFGARYYDAQSARFISTDPIHTHVAHPPPRIFANYLTSPSNGHIYTYVGNNPINHVDVYGLDGNQPAPEVRARQLWNLLAGIEKDKTTIAVTVAASGKWYISSSGGKLPKVITQALAPNEVPVKLTARIRTWAFTFVKIKISKYTRSKQGAKKKKWLSRFGGYAKEFKLSRTGKKTKLHLHAEPLGYWYAARLKGETVIGTAPSRPYCRQCDKFLKLCNKHERYGVTVRSNW